MNKIENLRIAAKIDKKSLYWKIRVRANVYVHTFRSHCKLQKRRNSSSQQVVNYEELHAVYCSKEFAIDKVTLIAGVDYHVALNKPRTEAVSRR